METTVRGGSRLKALVEDVKAFKGASKGVESACDGNNIQIVTNATISKPYIVRESLGYVLRGGYGSQDCQP